MDTSPFKPTHAPSSNTKVPSIWKHFTKKDSASIEESYHRLKVWKECQKDDNGTATPPFPTRIPAGEDHLFEVDVSTKDIHPIYWPGPVYDIRRGVWFIQTSGNTFNPCDDNLSKQLENGYKKYQPWNLTKSESNQSMTDLNASKHPIAVESGPKKWALFGPFMNQYVTYAGPSQAWLQSFTAMNISGTRLIRGYDEVLKFIKKGSAAKSKEKAGKDVPVKDKEKEIETVKEKEKEKETGKAEPEKESESDENQSDTSPTTSIDMDKSVLESEEEDRPIQHLIFVIHGIGQKLGYRVDTVNFAGDCGMVRQAIKETCKSSSTQKDSNIPHLGGVQLLPVMWRQTWDVGLKKDQGKDENQLSLDDITLEGVPSIRMLVSDVLLDVLLYLTPRFRQELISYVILELNRLYGIYKSRNPSFNGKVSLFGHSLGSLIAFDILAHQKQKPRSPKLKKQSTEVDLTELSNKPFESLKWNGMMESGPIEVKNLDFETEAFFALGSPIGLFLLLRGDTLSFQKDEYKHGALIPSCKKFFNVFHPFDPVAYRVEPFIDHRYKRLKPFPIAYTKGGLRGTFAGISDMMGNMTGFVSGAVSLAAISWFKSPTRSSISTPSDTQTATAPTTSSQIDVQKNPKNLENDQGKVDSKDSIGTTGELPPQPVETKPIEVFEPQTRYDFALQEGIMENQYLSALAVHMNYWSDQDCAAFIVKSLYDS